MSRPDPTSQMGVLVEFLHGSDAHHRESLLQLCKVLAAQDLFGRSRTPGHKGRFYQIRLLFAYVVKSPTMGKQTGRTRSESSTTRYLDSSVHGKVPVLRAGGETYLWMPAAFGGENVWRHVLTRGTSPAGVRKRIALKAGVSKNSAPQSAQAASNNPSPASNITQELDQLTSPLSVRSTFTQPNVPEEQSVPP